MWPLLAEYTKCWLKTFVLIIIWLKWTQSRKQKWRDIAFLMHSFCKYGLVFLLLIMQDSCLAVNSIFKYSRQICSSKQMFSETSQNSQKNTCAGVYLFLKTPRHRCFPMSLTKFSEQLFFRKPFVDCFWSCSSVIAVAPVFWLQTVYKTVCCIN